MITLRKCLLKMINVSDKFVENIKTHLLCSKTFFKSATYEITWKKYFRAEQTPDYNIAHAYCILIAKATITLSKCVIFIAFST